MPQHDDDAGAPRIAVTVVRTGGFAGIPRGWRVRADAADAQPWVDLVERCPWDQREAEPTGADRFVWEIAVHLDDDRRRADLADEQVQGPWRALVEAVREAGTATRPGDSRDVISLDGRTGNASSSA